MEPITEVLPTLRHEHAMSPDISVLMATYAGETASNLKRSLDSVWQQTVHPTEIVLVVDGPVDAAQEAVIEAFSNRLIGLKVIRRATSGGLARALNEGLMACTCGTIMRMDSDDVCMPDRIAIQMAYAVAHPDVDVLSSWAEDFYPDGAPSQMKVSPTEHDDVIAALRWRNVIVHPTVMIRTDMLKSIGGYRTEYGMLEDYDLYVRLAVSGARFHVIPKVLVKVCASPQQRARRGGLRYLLREIAFRAECRRAGFMTTVQFILVTGLYGFFRVVSGSMRRRLYGLVRV